MKRKSTIELLTEALEQADAPAFMVRRAKIGYYDDFHSPIATPLHQLWYDARSHGLFEIANDARSGKFNAQDWEAEAWAQSPEGQQMLDHIMGSLPNNGGPLWQLL